MFVTIYTDAQFCVILCRNLATVYHWRKVWDFFGIWIAKQKDIYIQEKNVYLALFWIFDTFFCLFCCVDPTDDITILLTEY